MVHLIAKASDKPEVPAPCDGVATAVLTEEQNLGVADDAPVTMCCWAPTVLTPEQKQSMQRYLALVSEARNHEATQKTLEAAKTFSSLAIQSSKQVLETARVYGKHALVGMQSFGKQLNVADVGCCTMHPGHRLVPQDCQAGENQHCPRQQMQEQQEQGDGVQLCVEPERVLDHIPEDELACMASAAHAESRACCLQFQVSSLWMPQAEIVAPREKQQSAEAQSLAPTSREVGSTSQEVGSTTAWRFDAGDGLHMDVRSQPDIEASRTGMYLLPGEEFQVSQELKGRGGVLYLRLADGRGWVFESKPGVGAMCFRGSRKA